MIDQSKEEKINLLKVDIETDILSAIKKMDEVDSKLLIVMQNNKFKSLLSIGDIQRSIIKDKSLQKPIKNILRDKISICFNTDDYSKIEAKMLSQRTEFMPIINAQGKLIDIVFWEDIFKEEFHLHQGNLNIPVVIMAGGKGVRLKPITNIIPKSLVPLGEKPIIEVIVDSFVSMGSNQFYFSVNYKAEMIKNYFDLLENKLYKIDYFVEPKPLGTAGSLHLLKGKIKSTFFVSNCDIIIDQEYEEVYKFHKEKKNELTIVAALKNYSIPYGTLEVGSEGVLNSLKEKPELTFMVNTGMYLLEPHLLHEIPENSFFHITQLIENIKSRSGKIGVFPVSEKSWFDIGDWKEYQQTLKILDQKNNKFLSPLG